MARYAVTATTANVAASPWSFPTVDQRSLKMSFEDDGNCAFYNSFNQVGTAEAVIWVSCPRRMTVAWTGMGEQRDPSPQNPLTFERMSLFIDNALVGSARSPGGGLECVPMATVVSEPTPPQSILLQTGIHRLRIETQTGDYKFHVGADYQFNLSFDPP